MPEYHISSLLVHTRPETLDVVAGRLEAEGCEVHERTAQGKIIVTLEAEGKHALNEALTRIQLLPGVLAATLVFHHVEPPEELARPI